MCGRFVRKQSKAEIRKAFQISVDEAPELGPSCNVAPTQSIDLVRERPARDGKEKARELDAPKWGLVPAWAKDPKIGARTKPFIQGSRLSSVTGLVVRTTKAFCTAWVRGEYRKGLEESARCGQQGRGLGAGDMVGGWSLRAVGADPFFGTEEAEVLGEV